MKYLLPFYIAVILLFTVSNSSAQSIKEYTKAADEAIENEDYGNALTYLRYVLDRDSTILSIGYKYAEASRLTMDYKTAEKWYSIVKLKDKGAKQFPECAFWLGVVRKDMGKYKEALRMFERYAKKNKKEDTYYTQKANNEIASCDSAMKLITDSQRVSIIHLNKNINTYDAEFGAFPLGDSVVYFSSFRGDSGNIENKYLRIFKSTKDSGNWKLAKQLDTIINSPEYNDGNVCFSSDYNRFYFTRCKYVNNSKTICEIYVREYKDGNWGTPVRLNDDINLEGYTATQPNIGANGDDGEILYFVSDRPGGMGNLDIWSCNISKDGKYGKPQNLGPKVNTIDDDISPFYHAATKTLYFSSEGHYGMGGFDVFKTKKDNTGNWTEAKNLGKPFNTRFNDLYFSLNERGDHGFITSNRTGALFRKNEHCCNDIFAFTLPVKDSILPPIKKDIEKEIKLLVPLTLYFHNDEPDNNTLDTVTKKSYQTTYDAYLAMLGLYKKQYSEGLKGDEKKDAEEDIADFFEDSVIFGYNQLEKFADLLLRNLEEGKECLVTLKGYCSPLASTDYNIHLAKRRVSCLRNYFNEHGNGEFKKYMESSGNGLLKFTEEAIGELLADPSVSDNPNDQRNSVYSRKAAKERKIQIIAISTSEKKN
jgi:WD40 repeat protein